MRTQVLFNRAPIEVSREIAREHEYVIPCWDNCAGSAHLYTSRTSVQMHWLPGLLREIYGRTAAETPWIFHIPLP